MRLEKKEIECIYCKDNNIEECPLCLGTKINILDPKGTNDNAYINKNLMNFLEKNIEKDFILIFEPFNFSGESPFPKEGETLVIDYISKEEDFHDTIRPPELEAILMAGVLFISKDSGKEIFVKGDSDFFKKVSLKDK
jgi:hypothetical protein